MKQVNQTESSRSNTRSGRMVYAASRYQGHGLDEKIGIAEFHQGTEFWYQMLKVLSQP